MNILEKKSSAEIDDKIKELLVSLKYKNNPIVLAGSSSLKSQMYFGDYDCMSAINKGDDPKDVYEEFNKIIEKIKKDPDLYFIELKIQTPDKKIRYYKDDKLDLKTIKDNFDEIEFFKIDLLMWENYHFNEVSIMYTLFSKILSKDEVKQNILDEIDEYKHDKMYYKALKRKFLIYKIDGNFEKMKELTKIFNSELGLKYKVASNIDAMLLALKYYDNKHTRQRVFINLQFLKLKEKYKLNELEKHSNDLKKEINDTVKEKYSVYLD